MKMEELLPLKGYPFTLTGRPHLESASSAGDANRKSNSLFPFVKLGGVGAGCAGVPKHLQFSVFISPHYIFINCVF